MVLIIAGGSISFMWQRLKEIRVQPHTGPIVEAVYSPGTVKSDKIYTLKTGILAVGIVKSFGTPPTKVLDDINLEIFKGEFVAITGRSGSGKSTLQKIFIYFTID